MEDIKKVTHYHLIKCGRFMDHKNGYDQQHELYDANY